MGAKTHNFRAWWQNFALLFCNYWVALSVPKPSTLPKRLVTLDLCGELIYMQ